jgi:exosortase/archaeosortase family protein
VPTDTVRSPTDPGKRAVDFVLRGVLGSLGFFGLLRLSWTEAEVVLPLTRAQAGLAAGLLGTPALPVEATLACSGADVMALCLGAIVAYPVKWRTRLAGAAAGVALILCLNTLRIGTLGRVAASPAWFDALHLYVWPAVLTLAVAVYVLAWMRVADRRQTRDEDAVAPRQSLVAPRPQPSRRFVVLTGTFLLLFLAASPLYLESPAVLALAGFIAGAAAATLGAFGVGVHAAANVLVTPRGAFLVTQECISTPLMPVYLAAVCAYSATWRRLILGVMAAVPLFIALGIVRLLVVAVPDVVASPIFLVHAFYQLLLGAVVVAAAAFWRHRGKAAFPHALAGLVAGVLVLYLLGPFSTRLVAYQAGAMLDDPQGAIALLPAFQFALYLALWIATLGEGESLARRWMQPSFSALVSTPWRRFLAGFALLGLTQTAGLLALHALASNPGLTAHVRDVRAWAVAGPLLIFTAVVHGARPAR